MFIKMMRIGLVRRCHMLPQEFLCKQSEECLRYNVIYNNKLPVIHLVVHLWAGYKSEVFVFLLSSCSISHCGSWTFWSGSNRVWCCTSCTLCCAPSAGITRSRWASFSSATTTCCSSCCETALCWAKPTRTPWTATAWASNPSEVCWWRLFGVF